MIIWALPAVTIQQPAQQNPTYIKATKWLKSNISLSRICLEFVFLYLFFLKITL